MDTMYSKNHRFRRVFANILSIFITLAMAFPVARSASAQETVLPEGWHDGMEGNVNAAGCTVFGWTVDPDNRDRDLQVQILADSNPVATTTANLLREDVGACTEGTCGFGVNLWGLVSAGVEHLITAQAYDEETQTWMDLSGTQKSLTCWGYPEGFHDYNQGNVPSWACNAGGWAMDPDDPERNLTVRILADGNEVTSTTAENVREDLQGTCGEDGSCGFEVGLWDLVAPYADHQITAQAYDQETNQWFDLSNSSKTLSCRTYDIYAFDPQTGETRQITNLPDTHEYNPRWSPDGKKIVHDTWKADWSSHGIYITDVKTGVSAPLAGAEGGSYPSWAPNEKWIAFDRGADNDHRLFIVPPTGGDPELVREDAFMASWAPNSQRLAFHQPSDGSIRTIELKGGSETIVAERGNGPAWSPDGEWIAFEVDGDIWKVNVDSHGNPLRDAIQLTSGPVWEGRPTWSNNSKTIAFHAGMGQDTDIWTIPASGGIATWLTGAPVFGDYDPNYSFSGRYVSYSSFSPDGQAARTWIANFSYDVGTWTEGEHSYYFENTYSLPEPGSHTSDAIAFNVSTDARKYNGYVLLRGAALRARVGSGCPAIDPLLHPDQNTRFGYGWLTDFPMTYAEAVAHFNSMAVKAYWDDGLSADLQRQEIFSSSSVDFGEIVCSSTEAPPEPVLYIHYEYPDVVEGDYELGHTVQVTVFDSEWNTKATATVNTMEMPHWGGAPGFRVDQWDGMEGPPDIQPGDVVRAVVDDGFLTVETRIGEITAAIDPEANSITGTIKAPWAGDTVNVLCMPWGAPEGTSEKETTVTPDGVSEFTCTWDPSEWDMQPGETAGVAYWGNDLHWVANAAANPWIIAFPEANQVFGYGWPVGSEVNLAINGQDIATVTVEGAPWDANDVMAFFDFNGIHDLVAGDVVVLSGSEMERTHTVQNLAVTEIDLETDTVSGTADSGATVHAWVHGFGQDVWLSVVEGTWTANLGSEGFQLEPGMCGRAEIRVEGSNSTNVDWCAPPKMDLRVNYGHDWVESFYEAGHQVLVTLTDPDANIKATATAVTEPKWYWGDAPGFQTLDAVWLDGEGNQLESPPDIQPYDWVYAQVDNGVTAQMQIGDIQGEVRFDLDSVTGTINVPWITDAVQVECLDWGSGGVPFNKDAGTIYTSGADPYSCNWNPETEWDVQPWQDIGVGYSTPDGHWVANAFRDERWMAIWTYNMPPGFWEEGEHSYYFQWAYTVPLSDSRINGPLTMMVASSSGDAETPIYPRFVLVQPWVLTPQLAWTGSSCEAVPVVHPDQETRFVWGWVNDFSMTYEEALAHFNSFTVEAYWDGDSGGSVPLTMGELIPFTGRDARWDYRCTLTEHP